MDFPRENQQWPGGERGDTHSMQRRVREIGRQAGRQAGKQLIYVGDSPALGGTTQSRARRGMGRSH